MTQRIIALIASLLLTACNSFSIESPKPTEQASLNKVCDDLPPLTDDTMSGLYLWSGLLVELYGQCKALNDAKVTPQPVE